MFHSLEGSIKHSIVLVAGTITNVLWWRWQWSYFAVFFCYSWIVTLICECFTADCQQFVWISGMGSMASEILILLSVWYHQFGSKMAEVVGQLCKQVVSFLLWSLYLDFRGLKQEMETAGHYTAWSESHTRKIISEKNWFETLQCDCKRLQTEMGKT